MAKIMKTMDGNTAAAYISYAFTEVAGIYPITPSSGMAELTDEWAAQGMKNIFGQTVSVVEMQSEAGAAGTVHGSLAAGALTTTYTASQGLLLMIPNMYKIAGELLPTVFHVSARALSAHALSIFGDHQDVMACRQTGFAMLAGSNVQEVMDIGAVAHLSTLTSRVPFLHFFDGFRTSHEVQKIECLDYEDLKTVFDYDALKKFRASALNPENPVLRGSAQNPDIYFQGREMSNRFYDAVPGVVEEYMGKINKLTGRNYKLFNYYGAPDADRVIIAMGSACDAITETVDFMNKNGEKVGLVNVHLYRPFSIKHFLDSMPKTVKKIAVLDRTKEPGSLGEPLYLDVCTAYFEAGEKPLIVGGRYGLGSKEFNPAHVMAVYENLNQAAPKNHFTVGIVDDVTNLSLPVGKLVDTAPDDIISCKFWGLGADGTVGASKNSIKIIGDNTDQYVQAYFGYDSKKSGGITTSYLRFGHSPIRSTYLINRANFIACHNASYVDKYDMVQDVKEGGTFLLNCSWDAKELDENLPGKMKRYIAENNIKFYTIDGVEIAERLGLGGHINTILQAAFFKLANIIPIDDAVKHMKDAVNETYGKKGDKVLNMNYAAIDEGVKGIVEVNVPASWKDAVDAPAQEDKTLPEFISKILKPVNNLKGDLLPVSTFNGREDGHLDQGSSAYEKRGIAVFNPKWLPENCIQCNQCSFVCPHATIRPFLLNEEEKTAAPEDFVTIKAIGKGLEGLEYRIQVNPVDCPGCGNCAQVCPAKTKALVMEPMESQQHQMENFNYAFGLKRRPNPMTKSTVKGSQFELPLFEYSGACTGCGETPYIKLITQLYGDRMYIANATGCTSIYGGSAPSTPYTKNQKGQGPAWASSLFEDNAEYGYGMFLGVKKIRDALREKAAKLMEEASHQGLKDALKNWLDTMMDGEASKASSDALIEALKGCDCEACKELLENKNHFVKKSQWIIGGDGWAYDIGFGGLDHVIAEGGNVNLLVLDTEVYSNTGGQSSKATPTAAIAKFSASGKKIRKKDLGRIAMTYGYVYVAQVAMGADQNQFIKAVTEAEAFDGPSVIIAYAPCIAHGIDMGRTQLEQKLAVDCGYWHLWRYNPNLEAEGKNPFVLDSKEPTGDYQQYLSSEGRFASLKLAFPDVADEMFKQAELDAKARYKAYKKLAE